MTTTVTLTDMLKSKDVKIKDPLEVIVRKDSHYYPHGTRTIRPAIAAGSENKPGLKILGYLAKVEEEGITLSTAVGDIFNGPIDSGYYISAQAIYDLRKVKSFK